MPVVPIAAERVGDLGDVLGWWEEAVPAIADPFALPDWLVPYADLVESGPAGRALRSYRCTGPDAATVALVLLTREAGGVVRLLGDPLTDRAGPVCLDPSRAPAALRAALAEELGAGDRFVGRALPMAGGWASLPGSRTVAVTASPFAELPPGGWDAYLAGRPPLVRHTFRTLDRQLAKGELRIRLVEEHGVLERALSAQVRMHEERWGTRSRLFAGPRLPFVEEACRRLLDRGALRMWVLDDAGDRPIAVYMGFRWRRAEWFWQHAWDREAAHLSPGRTVVAHALRSAFADGCDTFHLLLGDEAYKRLWADGDDPVVTVEIGAAT